MSTPGSEDTFARLVSLAVHDLRTPLATVSGFARTLQRTTLGDPVDKYVELMVSAGAQLADLLDELGLVARIEGGRWEPNVQEVDSRELAAAAAERVGPADVEGAGSTVRVDRDAATLALFQLARCTLRHGGLERVELRGRRRGGRDRAGRRGRSPGPAGRGSAGPRRADRRAGRHGARRLARARGRSAARPPAYVMPVSAARVSLLRWLRRQLRQPVPLREHLEAAVQNDDPAEARRLVEQMAFSEEQRRHVLSLVDAWEDEHA